MTSSIRFPLSLTIFLIAFSILALPSLAQDYKIGSPNAAALAIELHSGDPYKIAGALDDIPWNYSIEVMSEFRESVSPLVADGLISALDDLCNLHISGDQENYEDEWIYEILEPLMFYVAALEDERTIPLLLKASQFGGMAPLGLASFGPRIFPIILAYIESSERTIMELRGAFLALVRTVEESRPLDSSTHSTLRELSIRYLQGYVPEHLKNHPYSNTLKRRGMDIAFVLGDADLKPMVARYASEFPGFVKMYLEDWYDGPSEVLKGELSE